MANEEHLARFREGVKRWNKWRRENPDIHPDLSGANLNRRSGFVNTITITIGTIIGIYRFAINGFTARGVIGV